MNVALLVPMIGTTIFLIGTALTPRRYRIKRTIIINKPVAEVMKKVGDLNLYAVWHPWQQPDPTATKTVTGIPGTIGHQYAWIGTKTGEGTLTLHSINDHHIHFDLEFLKPWKSHADDDWFFQAHGNGETKATWQHNGGNLHWPMGRMMFPVIKMNLRRQLKQGLNNLKKICEQE